MPETEFRTLHLAVIAHDEPANVRETLLAAPHEGASAALARRILAAFGAIWKCRDPADIEAYVRHHAADVRMILVFELIHEGAMTPAIHLAADLAGCGHEL